MAKILFYLFLTLSLFSGQFYQRAERAFQDKVYKFAILSYQKEIDSESSEKEQSYYKIALCYFYLKEYQNALKKFDEYIQLYPNGKEKINAQFYQANIFYLQKNYEGAMNLILFSLEKEKFPQKQKERLYFLISDIYLAQDELELAIEELGKIEFYKNDLNARKGSLYYFFKKYQLSLEFFNKIIDGKLFYNDKQKISYQKIKVLIELKKYSLAEKEINSYLKEKNEENSIYWEIIFLKNSINHYQKNYVESIQDMKTIIKKYSAKVTENIFYKNLLLKAHLTLIEDYVALEQKILALSVLKNALKNDNFQNYRDELLWKQYDIYEEEAKGYDSLKEIYQIYLQKKQYDLNYKIVIEKIATSPFYEEESLQSLVKDYQKSKPTKKQKINFFKKLAVHLFEQNDFKNSSLFFEKIYNLEPKLSSLIAIGETYLKNNQSIRAIDFFSNLKLKGKQKNYQNDILGYSYLLNNDYLTSIKYYQKNIDNKEYKNKSFFYLAENYFLMNDYQKTIFYFKKFIKEQKIGNQYFHALYRMGFIYNHEKQYQKSVDILEKSIKDEGLSEFENKNEVYYFLAKSYFELKKYKETLKHAKKIVKDNFYYYDSIFLMGNAYLSLKNLQGAKDNYFVIINDEQAKQLLKNHSYYKLISLYLEKKNFIQAEFYLEKMLFFEQNDSEYFDASIYKIIDFYYANKKYEKISNLVERLQKVEINLDVKFYLFYMEGMSMLEIQEKDKAIITFEKAINRQGVENSKYYFEILYQLSLIYHDKKKYGNAKKYLLLLRKSNEAELRKEADKILAIVENNLFLNRVQKKTTSEIANLSPEEIPKNLQSDVRLILAKKYFFKKNFQKSFQVLQRTKLNFGVAANLVSYYFLKFKLLYELKKYSDLYKEGLEVYYQYEIEEDRKKILLFYVSYAAYKEDLKKDGDFFYNELVKLDKDSDFIWDLKKVKK